MEYFVLIVLQHRDVFVQVHHVIRRQDRDLAAPAGRVDDKVGNRHPAGMALQRADDVHPRLHRGAEMVGAFRQVRLVEVVWFHPSQQQLVHQTLHDVRVIVDAFEQDGLGAQRNAGIRQHAARGLHLRCQFVRMVEMQVHVDRVVLLDDFAELGGDALRQATRDARPDSDELQVRDRPQGLENAFQQVVGQQQRVASRQDHIADLRMFFQVRDGAIQLALFEKAGFAHQPLAGAEPTINRALVGHHQQHPVRISVHKVRHRTHQVFLQRVVRRVEVLHLGRIRDHLLPDRVALLLDRGHDRRGDAHGVVTNDGLDLFGIDAQVVGEVFRLHHAFSQYPFPFFHSSRFLLRAANSW